MEWSTVKLADNPVIMNYHRIPHLRDEGEKKSRESKPENYEINTKAEDTLISGQDITNCSELTYVDPL